MFRPWVIPLLIVLVATGCERKPGAAPPNQSEVKPASPPVLAPESLAWSREQAAEHLADAQLGLSAAVQLVRLAEIEPLCLPADASDAHLRRLALVQLAPDRWALGLADRRNAQLLRAAVVIHGDGTVEPLADGAEEEALVLAVSKDRDVFPHLVLLPAEVRIIADEVEPVLALEDAEKVRFELRAERGYSFVALVLSLPAQAAAAPPTGQAGDERGSGEVARYTWDHMEQSFIGPAVDKLPDPPAGPGGKFYLDLEATERLIPQGGELPEPEEILPPPPAPPEMEGEDVAVGRAPPAWDA
ncbi:MAG: hypothetical protein AB1716_10535 [Planctomycetota bacterium]